MAAHWYVINTYSGQEARAKAALLERARTHGRADAIEEVFIDGTEPTETAVPPDLIAPESFLMDQLAGPDAGPLPEQTNGSPLAPKPELGRKLATAAGMNSR